MPTVWTERAGWMSSAPSIRTGPCVKRPPRATAVKWGEGGVVDTIPMMDDQPNVKHSVMSPSTS